LVAKLESCTAGEKKKKKGVKESEKEMKQER